MLGRRYLPIRLLLFGAGGGRGRLRSLTLPPVTALAADFRHVLAVPADGLATFTADFRHVLAIFADRCTTFAPDFRHVNAISADRFASFATDPCHVATILTDRLATLSPCFSGLLGRKFMRPALDVGCFSPLARDLTLPLLIHRGESAPRFFIHDDLLICPDDEANGVPLLVALCRLLPRQVPHAAAGETRDVELVFRPSRDRSASVRNSRRQHASGTEQDVKEFAFVLGGKLD
jgi:hypothetical protein